MIAQTAPVPHAGPETLWTFVGFVAAVLGVGAVGHRMTRAGSFLGDYFLGGRAMGSWTLAFTVAATAISGGTFLGIPALLYSNGWSAALWVAGFMITPLVSMALFAKRINAVGRRLGSLTVPDLLRDRFASPALGLTATAAILFFLTCNLVAQFKGGGLIMQTVFGPAMTEHLGVPADRVYHVGVAVFAVIVVAYTAYGGFWAIALTDLLEGLVMLVGAVMLVPLVLSQVGGLPAATERIAAIDPDLTHLPGPGGILPITLAVSFFLYWPLVSAGQPSGMVRLMAFSDTRAFRRALLLVSVYFTLIYGSLVLTFTSARALFPTEFTGPGQADRILPAVCVRCAPGWAAGLLLAAPFAAIMSTVAAYILMIGSGLVRDVWQRNIHPDLSPRAARIGSVAATAAVGLLAALLAMHPPNFLQYVILFTGSGLASGFLAVVVLGLYWPGMTRAGALAAMLCGLGTHLALWAAGFLDLSGGGPAIATAFKPVYLLGMDPAIWGVAAGFAAGVGVSRCTTPPSEEMLERVFGEG